MPNITGTMLLSIMKGIAKTPLDSQSAEIGIDSVNLLDPNGFSCDEYIMKTPTMKSSAVYADSPLTDGRTLINGAMSNVNEVIRMTLNSSTLAQMSALLSKLARMKHDCLSYWSTFGQIEPLYIRHQVQGEPGSRFALLYDIDIDIETPLNPSVSMRTITLNIEREPFWRWEVAPGANPKKWTFYKAAYTPTTLTDWNLGTGSRHLLSDAARNKREWNATQTGILSRNYVDIPAASIPGDAPALASIHIAPTITSFNGLVVARSTKPTSLTDRETSTTTLAYNTINAGDGAMLSDASVVADATAPASNSSGSGQRVTVTFAGTTAMAERVRFDRASLNVETRPNFNLLRGRYLVYLRAKLSAASTVLARINFIVDTGSAPSPAFVLGDASVTDASGSWHLYYMGVASFPFWTNGYNGINGLGLSVNAQSSVSDLYISISAQRTGGATNLHIADIVLIPFDEACIKTTNLNAEWLLDSTGYLTRGKEATVHDYLSTGSTSLIGAPEWSGQPITLEPGIDNRLIYLGYNSADMTTDLVNYDVRFRINIVPRSIGLRYE